jgi:hypothetical protein
VQILLKIIFSAKVFYEKKERVAKYWTGNLLICRPVEVETPLEI